MDSDQVFRLIDSILPFEACLYHQVLPLCLEGSHLKLGMVNLEDTAATDYVRRILAYMNCSLVPQRISSNTHQSVLSAYLHHTGSQQNAGNVRDNSRSWEIANRIERKLAQETDKKAVDRPPVPVVEATPTLLVDSPEELEQPAVTISPPPDLSNTSSPSPVDKQNVPPEQPVVESSQAREDRQTNPIPPHGVQESPTFLLDPETPQLPASRSLIPVEQPPILQVHAKHLEDPVEVLATLTPPDLLQELLGRVLVAGIGRLYFERQQQYGRILWSQNGVLQSILEKLPLATLQGVINELKLLTGLRLLPVQKPRQIEIERIYLDNRLLVRLRVMPAKQGEGEEATLQVLRGAALKFYQQQQIANLSRDVLGVAQELQRKVDELYSRTRCYPLSAGRLDILPSLERVLQTIEQQVETLKSFQSQEQAEEKE